MQTYAILKHVHVTAAVLSMSGFLFRACLMLRRSPMAEWRSVQQWPHVVDTVLLGAALGMVWVGGRAPFSEPWLSVKIACLVAYIVCGALALKRAPTDRSKRIFLVLALLFMANIVTIALTRDPWGLLAFFRR